jgi:broad specificity phosphatase PhoE
LAAAWGLSVEAVETDARLREMSFGEWEGRAWEEIEAADSARFAAWSDSWWSARAPGGEGYPDLAVRAEGWLADCLADRLAGPPGRTVVAVAHDGSLRALLALLAEPLDLPREEIFHLRLDHAHVSGIFDRKVLFANATRFPAP